MESTISEFTNKIYDYLHELSEKFGSDDHMTKGSYRLVSREGTIFHGAKMDIIFSDVNLAGAILAARAYLFKNTDYEEGTYGNLGSTYDFLRYHIMYLIDCCSGFTEIEDQAKMIMRFVTNPKNIIHLKKTE